ncbi:MAG: type II secretion system protein [Bacilli bacterium]|nr:type II secretion system protein [Bacilli bacterium]
MIKNKKGVTLMELLAYITLIGIIGTLLTGTFILGIRSYDRVNGQGALDQEANFINSILYSAIQSFQPQYIRYCDRGNEFSNCVELVVDTVWEIDENTGILVQKPVPSEDRYLRIWINPEDNGLYLNNTKINNDGYQVIYHKIIDGEVDESQVDSYISYNCNIIGGETCQKFTLRIRLALKADKPRYKSRIIVYESRFAY